MTKAYEIVELAKEKNSIESDNAFAIRFGFRRQNVNDWKIGRSEPKGVNLLKLIKAADLTVDEAIEIMSESEKNLKEAGFSTLPMMIGLSGISGMTILAMSHLPYQAIGATFMNSASLYIMLNGNSISISKIEAELLRFTSHNLRHFEAANDIEINQVSTNSNYENLVYASFGKS